MQRFHPVIWSALVVLTVWQPVNAQIEITPVTGLYRPARALGTHEIVDRDGNVTGSIALGRRVGPLVGLRVGTSVVGRFGFEAAALFAWSQTRTQLSQEVADMFSSVVRTHVQLLSARAVFDLGPQDGALRVRVHGGPAYLGFGNSWLAFDRARWAASLGGGFDYALSRTLDLVGDVEAYIYDDIAGAPRQTDLGFSVGVRFREPIQF